MSKFHPLLGLVAIVVAPMTAHGDRAFAAPGAEQASKSAEQSAAELSKRADAGDAEAMFHLGDQHRFGKGVQINFREAAKWYQQAAAKGHVKATMCLGRMHLESCGVDRNYLKAVNCFRTAAEAGDTDAMCHLGQLYEDGQGVRRDPHEADHWFRKAAEAGSAKGMWNLARRLRVKSLSRGPDAAANRQQASEWLTKAGDALETAAKAGDPEAMLILGSLLSQQTKDEQRKEGVAWCLKAAEVGLH